MGVTANYSFPYPAVTDAPNGPAQIEALAAAVDTELKTIADGGGWVTLTLLNGWTGTLQVKLLGIAKQAAIRTIGTLNTGTLAPGTTLAVLDTAYWPAQVQRLPFIITAVGPGSAAIAGDPFILIDETGDVAIEQVATQVATNGTVNGIFWLD